MGEIVAIITLSALNIFLVIERYFYSKEMNKQLENNTKAIMSRNISEYLAATNSPKSDKNGFIQNDEVDISEADDEVFLKSINNPAS